MLLSFIFNVCYKRRPLLWFIYQIKTHKQHKNLSWIVPHAGIGHWNKRSHAKRSIARTTTEWRLWKYIHSKWHPFEVHICSPSFQTQGAKHRKSDHRYHDTTRMFVYAQYNRQRKRFSLPGFTWRKLGINLKHATTKHAQTFGVPGRANATIRFFFENVFRRIEETMDRRFTHCDPYIQHDLSFHFWL